MRDPEQNACRLSAVTRVPRATSIVLALVACQGRPDASPTPSKPSAAPSLASEQGSRHAQAGAALASAAIPGPSAAAPGASAAWGPEASPSAAANPQEPAQTPPLDPQRYPWLAGGRDFPKPDASLEERFRAPPGYSRVTVAAGSFAAWLRGLPLAPEGTPAQRFDGRETLAADDDYLAGVVAIDTGTADLQQSSDVIIRLHAEYLWSRGEKPKISYLSASKLSLPFWRWEKGQRLIANGPNVFWAVKGKPSEADHDEFRRYLDAVFNWANTSSLALRSTAVSDPTELVAGDFFLQSKEPNHVAVVLDIAEKPSGERVALLGQARSPAESIHVVRPGKATPWFSVRPPVPVMTPHSKALAWSDLRRMTAADADK